MSREKKKREVWLEIRIGFLGEDYEVVGIETIWRVNRKRVLLFLISN